MTVEYYRAAKPVVVLGIPRPDIESLFRDAGVLGVYGRILDLHTQPEPFTVELQDAGYNPASPSAPQNYPKIVGLDVVQFQIDAGANEVPRASVRLAAGRSGIELQWFNDRESTAPGHLLEKYLATARLPAKLYANMTSTAASGAGDVYDNLPWSDGWVVLFDGRITHLSRRGTGQSMALVVHLAHFTETLGHSSSLTGQAAAGAYIPAAMSPSRFVPSVPTANSLVPSVTPYGAAALAIGSGQALYTDFWGYRIPADPATSQFRYASVGLKGWLAGLADQDVFAWESLRLASGSACPAAATTPVRNDGAAAALSRIEPIWPVTDEPASAGGRWNRIHAGVTAVAGARAAAGSTTGVSRADLIGSSVQARDAYYDVGYRYGLPSSFYLSNANLAPLASGRAFAHDVAGATFGDLAGNSHWQLLVGRYASNYQLTLVPMATRGLVVPFQPLRHLAWQSIGASEITSWEDSAGNPVPVRGVVLVGDFPSSSGGFANGSGASTPGAQARYQNLQAAYDGCDPGVFEFREMPPWLVGLHLPAEAYGAYTLAPTGRALSVVPWAGFAADGLTHAARTVDAVVGMIGAPTLNAAYALSGVLRHAAKTPPPWVTSTGARLAKALWQQERTRHNTYYATTRFRYDIAPGSSVRLALPTDKYVGDAIADIRDTSVIGTVIRVTLVMDRESDTAETHLQLGFVRTESQSAVGSKLYADHHPFWATSWYGAPWADSRALRLRLGDGSAIPPTVFGP